MNPRSLSFRLSTWYAGICLVVGLGFAVFTYFWLSNYLNSTLAATLTRRASQVAALWRLHAEDANRQDVINDIKAGYAPEHNDRFFCIHKSTGEIFYKSGKPADATFDPEQIPFHAVSGESISVRRFGPQNMLIASRSLLVGANTYIVEVGSSLDPVDRILHAYLSVLLIGVPITFLIAVGGGIILVRQSLKPVRQIIRAAQDLTYHNLRNRLPVTNTGDELQNLSVVLNQMLDRLETAFQHSQQFSALASHELRTPLTIILGELEAVLRSRDLSENVRMELISVLEEVEHLIKIVEGLFAIARLQVGDPIVKAAVFDLSLMVTNTSEQMTLLAEEKNITVECKTEPGLEIMGDQVRMRQLIVNLLDNAIKYTPAGKKILLDTKRQDGNALFTVADEGPGISEKSLPHVFESFYRAEEEHIHQADGVGLGLSIVKFICSAHRGTVSAANRPSGGCLITVSLPLRENA